MHLICTQYALNMHWICMICNSQLHGLTLFTSSLYQSQCDLAEFPQSRMMLPEREVWPVVLWQPRLTHWGVTVRCRFLCYYALHTETYIHNRIQIYIQIYVSDWYYMTTCNHLGLGLILLWPISTLYMWSSRLHQGTLIPQSLHFLTT